MLRFLFFLGNLFLTSPSLAGSVNVAQWIPWSFVTQTWGQQSIAMDQRQETLQLSWQELRPVARGIDFRLDGALSKTRFTAQGLTAEAQNVAAQLRIQQLSINQIVKLNLNGNVISIRLEAQCTPLQVTIPNFALQVAATFVQEEASWRPALSDLALAIPATGWSISPFSCTGLGGIGGRDHKPLERRPAGPASFSRTDLAVARASDPGAVERSLERPRGVGPGPVHDSRNGGPHGERGRVTRPASPVDGN